jgi:hypothetical protein
LQRKGQPGLDFGIQLLLAVQVHRHMQQRARRRDPQALAQALASGSSQSSTCQVGLPDVAAVDHAQRQHLVAGSS